MLISKTSQISKRVSDPKQALDYPHLDDALFVIWSNNDRIWPDAARRLSYLSADKKDSWRRCALFTINHPEAATFVTREEAQAFLDENNKLRPHPYRVKITTVAELKSRNGYSQTTKDCS